MIKNEIEKIAYKNIISLENLKKGLARTKTNVDRGIDGEVKASFTEKKLQVLFKELKSQRFKPSSVKRVNIPKLDGRTRVIGTASSKDKIVQAAILNLLEPLLENVFLDSSYGGRQKKNCHHALKHIKSKWQNITWFIHIELQNYFDTKNHDILLEMLEEYCDQAVIELIRKFLKCGYIDFYINPEKLQMSIVDIPQQVSLISPILSNLFLHPLDRFIQDEFMTQWNRGDERKFVSEYKTCQHFTAEQVRVIESSDVLGNKEFIEVLKHNKWVNQGLLTRDLKDNEFRRIRYVRYVDDFIIGFTGTKTEAEDIKNQIEIFVGDRLKLTINKTNSYISHSSEKGITYLGYYLRYLPVNKVFKDDTKSYKDDSGIGHQLKATAINQLQLRIPVDLILLRAVDWGYAKIRKDGKSIRATSCRKLSSFEDKRIVQRFSTIIRGLMEYYAPANRRSDLWKIVALYRKSCALTLADKHKIKTSAKVYKIYGPKLKITDPIKKKETVLFYPTTLKTISNFKLGSS